MSNYEVNAEKATENMRQTALTYVGLQNAVLESGLKQMKSLYASSNDVLENLLATQETLQAQSAFLFGGAEVKTSVAFDSEAASQGKNLIPSLKVSRGTDFGTDTDAASNGADVAALKTKIAALTKELNAVKASAAKVSATKAAVSTPAKAPAVKAKSTKAKSVKTGTAKKTAPKADDKYAPYLAKVVKYDPDAQLAYVKKIVNYLGIALTSRDGQLVACSDPSERDTVRDNFLAKKLGVTGEQSDLDAKVLAVCETMKASRLKNRVVFYYLLAQQEGKLGAL